MFYYEGVNALNSCPSTGIGGWRDASLQELHPDWDRIDGTRL